MYHLQGAVRRRMNHSHPPVLGDDVGFIPLIMAGLTIASQVAQQVIARKQQKKAAAQVAAQVAAEEAAARAAALRRSQASSGFMGGPSAIGGMSPIMLGLMVGIPLVTILLLKK